MIKTLEKIQSKNGKDIELLEISPEKDGKNVLIIGVFHGDEPQGEVLIRKFLEERKTLPKNRLLIIPCLNPDGKELNTRQNANGIDLNRNFPTKNHIITDDEHYFGGKTPASEVETRFMIKIIEEYKPDFILSLHAPYRVVNYDGDAKQQAEEISKLTGYPVEEDIGYATPGSFGTYAGKERQIPTITLELPEDKTDGDLWREVKSVFDYCADEV
ncbi:MAG: murein peptide amidase A [Candidatus Gastranaerophilales bacterium]|nr:murein peptide amidase A [Candidatus Gastranaerophilales bacterium]